MYAMEVSMCQTGEMISYLTRFGGFAAYMHEMIIQTAENFGQLRTYSFYETRYPLELGEQFNTSE